MNAMQPKLTFWFEFASTYSYLSAMRIGELADQAGVKIIWRPFLLGPIFQAQGWKSSPFNIYEAKGRYMWRDMQRQCALYDLPEFIKPDPFPQKSVLAARVAILGADEAWVQGFVRSVYSAQFAKGLSLSDDTISSCLDQIGQDGTALVQQAKTDQIVKDRLRATTQHAQEIGIFGAPSFETEDGEIFWGNDRLEQALDWACKSMKP